MLHSLGVSFGLLSLRALNLSIFILRLGGGKLGQRMMQASAFFPILPHNLQRIVCLMHIAAITGWRDAVLLLVEYEGKKEQER